ncbi:MAG TPA: hypothetical protein VF115_11915 [Acidimicrobiia bacterium]
MSLSFRSKRRNADKCSHPTQIRLEIAGMSRAVCEDCGRVSVTYIDDHLHRTKQRQPAKETVAS